MHIAVRIVPVPIEVVAGKIASIMQDCIDNAHAVKEAHVRELVRPMTEQGVVLLQALNDEPSFLFLAVKEGHVEVVRALLEAGGRELVMLTSDNGASCLMISAEKGHLEVVNALLAVGGRELVMLTADNGFSCLMISAQEGHLEVVNALLEAGGRELAMR